MSPQITPLADPGAGAASRRLAWLASGADGVLLESASLRLFTRQEQEHLAELEIAVHGAERRQGVGPRLLDAAVATARAAGRRSVLAQAEQGLCRRSVSGGAGLSPGPGSDVRPAVAGRRGPPGDREADPTPVPWLPVDRVRPRRSRSAGTCCTPWLPSTPVTGPRSDSANSSSGRRPGRRAAPRQRRTPRTPRSRPRPLDEGGVHPPGPRTAPRLAGLRTGTADGNAPMRAVNDTLGYLPPHRTVEYRFDL